MDTLCRILDCDLSDIAEYKKNRRIIQSLLKKFQEAFTFYQI
ncbi:MAG: hypothetical protein ACI4V4_01755 [Eubacterium sp.]